MTDNHKEHQAHVVHQIEDTELEETQEYDAEPQNIDNMKPVRAGLTCGVYGLGC